MSCSSTRTSHNICVPGCPEENGVALCPCPATAAFACRPLCPCPELEDNVFFSQGKLANQVCSEVASLPIPVPPAPVTLVALVGFFDDIRYTSVHCPVVISIEGVTGALGTITNGTFTAAVVQPTVPVGPHVVLVNGKPCIDVLIA